MNEELKKILEVIDPFIIVGAQHGMVYTGGDLRPKIIQAFIDAGWGPKKDKEEEE